jgi:hypothetical protein
MSSLFEIVSLLKIIGCACVDSPQMEGAGDAAPNSAHSIHYRENIVYDVQN